MADETSVPPNNGKDISVTRMTVGTAEVKDMKVDLLTAVNASINEQTETLSKQNEEILKTTNAAYSGQQKSSDSQKQGGDKNAGDIVKAIEKLRIVNEELIATMRTSGGESGGESENVRDGLAAAELKTNQKSLHIVTKLAEGDLDLIDVKKALIAITKAETNVAMAALVEGLIETGRSVLSFRTAVEQVTKGFTQSMDLSKSGIADFSDVYLDSLQRTFEFFANGLDGSRDNLIETSKLVKESMQNGLISPMQLVQGNLKDVSTEFHNFRESLEEGGLDLYRNLGFRDQNAILSQLLDAQLRGDRMTDINDDSVKSQTADQIASMRIIASNTGLSLDELIKGNAATLTKLAELEASGALSGEMAAKLGPVIANLEKSAPQFSSAFLNALQAGDTRAVYEAKFGEEAAAFRKLGVNMFAEVQKIKKLGSFKERTDATTDLVQRISDQMKQRGPGAASFLLGGQYEQFQKLATEGNVLRKLQMDLDNQSDMTRILNKFDNFITNDLPVSDFAKFAGSILFNTLSLGANTAALIANTIARGSDAASVGLLSSVLGKAGKLTMGLLRFGGVLAGGAMIGKDVYDVATGNASGENIGGIVGGAVGGGLGALTGPLAPLAIPAGMILGNMAGNFIGGLSDSTPGAPGAPGIPAPTALSSPMMSRTNTMPPAGGQVAVVKHMTMQTRLLENIAGSMVTGNSIQREIRDKIGFNNLSTPTRPRDSSRKGSNISIVPEVLGSG